MVHLHFKLFITFCAKDMKHFCPGIFTWIWQTILLYPQYFHLSPSIDLQRTLLTVSFVREKFQKNGEEGCEICQCPCVLPVRVLCVGHILWLISSACFLYYDILSRFWYYYPIPSGLELIRGILLPLFLFLRL